MNVYRRKDNPIYQFKFEFRGVVVRRSTGTTNHKAALRIAQKAHTDHVQRAQGVVLDVDRDVAAVPLSDLSARYLEWAKHDHPSSVDEDVRVVARFVEIVGGGETFVHTVSASRIDWWRSRRRKDLTRSGTPVSASRVNRELNIVRALFRQAVLWEHIATSPCAGLKDFKAPGQPVRILTADELERAFTLLPEPFNLFCEVTFRTLARLGEVTRLRREHVTVDLLPDGQRIGTLMKRVKGGEWKRVRIPLALAERLRAQGGDDAHLFPDHQNSDSTSAQFSRLFTAANLRCSHHAFRHSGITRMLEAGVNPRAIQEHAGWSSLKQLQRYGRVLDQEFARAVDVTDAFLQRHREAKAQQAHAQTGTTGAHLALVPSGGGQ